MDQYAIPWMDDDLVLYRDQVRRFVQAEMVPQQKQWRAQRHVERSMWHRAGTMGWLLADIPQAYGGGGGDFAHMAVFWEELIAAGEVGFGSHVHAVVAHYLLEFGTEAQKQHYLPRLARGELIGAIAASEPQAGSDLQGITCRAVQDDDGYLIEGSKTFVSNGHLADLVLLLVRTDPAAGGRGLSLLLVETANLPGFSRGPILEMLGRKGHDVCELFFDRVRLPATALLGTEQGHGLAQLAHELPYERILLALCSVASIQRALQLAHEHSLTRKVFGKPLFDLQNTRFTLAEAKTKLMVARVFVDWCICQLLDGKLTSDEAAMAKWYLSQLQCEVVDQCLQLFGGYGYMLDYPIAQMYADARVQKIYGGSNEIMKEIIAYAM